MNSEGKVQYTIHKSRKRSSVAIKVTAAGTVEVYAPSWCRESEIEEILRKKSAWIEEKVGKYLAYAPNVEHAYISGEVFYHLGRPVTLTLERGERAGAALEDGRLLVWLPSRVVDRGEASRYCRSRVIEWYRREALQYLSRRTAYWETIHPELKGRNHGAEITVRKMRRRWGSCDRQGNIRYNLQLVCAPEKFIDCIIVHELCHRLEFGHGKAFMRLVCSYIPDYREYMEEAIKQAGLWSIS